MKRTISLIVGATILSAAVSTATTGCDGPTVQGGQAGQGCQAPDSFAEFTSGHGQKDQVFQNGDDFLGWGNGKSCQQPAQNVAVANSQANANACANVDQEAEDDSRRGADVYAGRQGQAQEDCDNDAFTDSRDDRNVYRNSGLSNNSNYGTGYANNDQSCEQRPAPVVQSPAPQTREVRAAKNEQLSTVASESLAAQAQGDKTYSASKSAAAATNSASLKQANTSAFVSDNETYQSSKDINNGKQKKYANAQHKDHKKELDLVRENAKENGMEFAESKFQAGGIRQGMISEEDMEVKEHIKAVRDRCHGEKVDKKKWMKKRCHKKTFQEKHGAHKKDKSCRGQRRHANKYGVRKRDGARRAKLLGDESASFAKINKREQETDFETARNRDNALVSDRNSEFAYLNNNENAQARDLEAASKNINYNNQEARLDAVEARLN